MIVLCAARPAVAAPRVLNAIGPATHADGSPGTAYADGGLGTAVERTLTPTLVVDVAAIPNVGSPPASYSFIVADRAVTDCSKYDVPVAQGGALEGIVWESDSETNSVTVPAGKLSDNTTYFWCAFAEWDEDEWMSGVSDFKVEVMAQLTPLSGVGLVRSVTPPLAVGFLPQANPALTVSYQFRLRANVGPIGLAGSPGAIVQQTTTAASSWTPLALTDLSQYWWEVTATAPVPGSSTGAVATRVLGPIRMFVNQSGVNLPLKPLEGLGQRVWTIGPDTTHPSNPSPQILSSANRQMRPLCLVLIVEYNCSTNPFNTLGNTSYPYQYFSMTDWAIRADGTKCYSCSTTFMWSGNSGGIVAGTTQSTLPGPATAKTFPAVEPDIWFRWDALKSLNSTVAATAQIQNGKPVYWAATVRDNQGGGGGDFPSFEPASFTPQYVPAAVVQQSPANLAVVTTATPTLTIGESAPGTLGGSGKSYRFIIYDSASGQSPLWQSAAQITALAAPSLSFTVPAGVLSKNGANYWWTVEGFFDGYSGGVPPASQRTAFALNAPPTLPRVHSPGDTGRVATLTPTLQVLSGPNSPLAPISYQFQVATDSAFASIVGSNPNWTLDPSFTVPDGVLHDGQTYYWRAQARNKFATTGWSATTSFSIGLEFLGRGEWAMADQGPVSVNLKTGNAVLTLPGPEYPTTAGVLGLSVSYNSQDPVDEGFGPGVRLGPAAGGADDTSPVRLVDHNLVVAGGLAAREDVISVVSGDGWGEFYKPTGDGLTYVPDGAAGATLRRRGPRVRALTSPASWTLTLRDGSIYTFGDPDPATGEADLLGSEVVIAKRNQARLVYRSDGSGRLIGIVDLSHRVLTLDWGGTTFCTDAIVCVSLRDDADTPVSGQQKRKLDQVIWKYQGSGTNQTAGPLLGIARHDGTTQRSVSQIGWTATNPKIQTMKGANTLNPPAGHNGQYSLGITYDTPVGNNPARVTSITEGPVTGRTPATATWAFSYNPIGTALTTNPTQADHAPHIGVGVTRTAASVATIQSPRGGVQSVWMDERGRAIQARDALGRTRQSGFAKSLPVWSEDPSGAATDTTYDPTTLVPTQVLAQSVQVVEAGATVTKRPETLTFYDESVPSNGRAEGQVLAGLRADYYDNRNLAGRPYATRTDPNVDFDWTAQGYPAPLLGATGQAGTTQIVDDYSVRWSGTIDLPAGTYVFSTVANGGTRMTIDGALVLSRWSDDGTTSTVESDPVVVTAGRHRAEVSFFDGTGAAVVSLKYRLSSAPAASTAVLPSSVLRPAYLNPTSTVSATGKRGFSHFAEPWTGLPDYSLTPVNPGLPTQQDLITSYTYDQLGRATSKTMPRGNTGRLDVVTGTLAGAPDSRFTTTWVYYGVAAGEAQPYLADIPACNGETLIAGAYQAGGLKEKRVPGLAAKTYVYDAAGRTRSTTNGRGRTCTTYTAEGRAATVTTRADNAGLAETTTYTYDPAGQVLTVSTPGKGVVTTQYNEASNVIRTLDSATTPPPPPPGTATDATAPTVIITSPGPSATVTGTDVSVSAEAEDDVNVVGVQFKLNGGNLGPEDTRPPFRILWDSTKAGNGANQLTAVARDASGKQTTSTATTVTVTGGVSGGPAGLVAAYNFNEGTGNTTLTDRSGTGNTGSLVNGPTWVTTGKYGGALQFDGVNDRVNVPDANSLDLTAGMTIEAWVYPTAGSAQKTILEKQVSGSVSYGMVHNPSRVPEGGVATSAGVQVVSGNSPLALSTWTHVAITYDSTTVRLYVSGIQVATRASSLPIVPTTGPLSIGGNTIRPAEWFTGRIDDVRVYNRALSATQLLADLQTAVVQSAPSATAVATIPAGDGATETTLVYDQESNPVQRNTAPGALSAGQGHTVNYTYNSDNSLATQEIRAYGATTAGDTYTYSYDTRGALKGIQYPGNVAYSWRTYNAAGWVTGLYNRHGVMPTGASSPTTVPATDTSPIADYVFTYDADRRKLQELLSFDTAGTQTRSYTYDSVGRLATYRTPAGLTREYRYDLDSNRTEILETPSGGAQASVATYTYDPGTPAVPNGVDQLTGKVEAGQTTTYGYHPDGELRLETRGASTSRDMTGVGDWDGSGLLVAGTYAGTRVVATLDPVGGLKARGSSGKTTEYLGGTFERSGGRVTRTVPMGALVEYAGAAPSGTKTYSFLNGHGDLAATTSATGIRSGGVLVYDAFGLGEGQSLPANATTERYTAQWQKKLDTASGLIAMGVRPYDPQLGRFMAVDPIEGGSVNAYDYGAQDPVNAFDLDGTVVIGPSGGGSSCTPYDLGLAINVQFRSNWRTLAGSIAVVCTNGQPTLTKFPDCNGKQRGTVFCRKSGDGCAAICRFTKRQGRKVGGFVKGNASSIIGAAGGCVGLGVQGAALGSLVPVVGTGIGAAAGCVTGGVFGWFWEAPAIGGAGSGGTPVG